MNKYSIKFLLLAFRRRVFCCERFIKAAKKVLGIPFVITNYFSGNKSVFAVLNSHQRTLSTISVVCLAKTVPQDGDFFSAKMRSTEKS